MIKFGSWSTTLGLAAGFGALVAALLLIAPRNRVANRFLAALLAVAVLRLMPYVIGFAGFYDAYPWLSFAPFDLALAIGPLLYLYIRRLATAQLPRRWGWHFAPAAVDLAYNLWAFSLPLAQKLQWNDTVHERWIDPMESVAGILSLSIYLVTAVRFLRRYQAWLVENVSDREEHRQRWLATVLLAVGLWLGVTLAFDLINWLIVPLSYRNRFPEYLVFSGLILWLGLEGWRHADHRFPVIVARAPTPDPVAPPRDWKALAQQWQTRIRVAGWWREPGLTLADVARRLATNETYISRSFNEGLGLNFNAVINGFRVEAVKTALGKESVEVLAVALEAGFSSKASFNRVFREHTGLSPTAWRAAHWGGRIPKAVSETPKNAPET